MSGITYVFKDYRDNLIVDADAPVAAWRQAKGHRLGHENSHEAMAWNVFRGLDQTGGAGAALGLEGHGLELRFWARGADGAPWAPFADARAALEEHLKGPDVNGAEPAVVAVDATSRTVLFVDAALAASVESAPPRWFGAAASRPAEQRRRRALLLGMTHEEGYAETGDPFSQPLAEVMRRGFYHAARKLLLARAVARRLGDGWTGRLLTVVNPPTMKRALEQTVRFERLVACGGYSATTWAALWQRVPDALRPPACGAWLGARTVNRKPAQIL